MKLWVSVLVQDITGNPCSLSITQENDVTDVISTKKSIKIGPNIFRLTFLGQNRKKPFFGPKNGQKTGFFGVFGMKQLVAT